MSLEKVAYFRRKWGRRYSPGISRKAGNVIRLKIPKVIKVPKRAEERIEDRRLILLTKEVRKFYEQPLLYHPRFVES